METNDSHIESGVGPATVWDITEAWSGDLKMRTNCGMCTLDNVSNHPLDGC
ncbi:Hypothetical protein SMAX5B_014705 [Scophthalmus maximus]|uniref:Uncharacterized protein n=1 Tax=Scophthalmus maximus TaxID=52904 RepID=A0A2U9BZH5_SCOMX|nr:Hypothetical protein SMAX5B_014705 [Scophthalmus maximus]